MPDTQLYGLKIDHLPKVVVWLLEMENCYSTNNKIINKTQIRTYLKLRHLIIANSCNRQVLTNLVFLNQQ